MPKINTWQKRVAVLVIAALPFLAPIVTKDPYILHIVVYAAISVIMAVSLRLILNTGQLSIAHASFMAIGAYTSAVLTVKAGVSFWLALPASGIIAGIVALGIGLPTLRMKGLYFALATFASGEIVVTIFKSYGRGVFGGPPGITGIQRPAPFASDATYCVFVLVFMLLAVLVAYRVDRSRVGAIISGVRQSDALSESIGISAMKYKVLAFVIGCIMAGVAGSLFAHFFKYISPEHFTFWISVDVLVYVIVGGQGSVWGPIVGVLAFTAFTEGLSSLQKYQAVFYGVAMGLVIMFLPGGLLSLPRRISGLLRRGGKPAPGEAEAT